MPLGALSQPLSFVLEGPSESLLLARRETRLLALTPSLPLWDIYHFQHILLETSGVKFNPLLAEIIFPCFSYLLDHFRIIGSIIGW